jgi:hypothetical protein
MQTFVEEGDLRPELLDKIVETLLDLKTSALVTLFLDILLKFVQSYKSIGAKLFAGYNFIGENGFLLI